jgi:hypothetical protein
MNLPRNLRADCSVTAGFLSILIIKARVASAIRRNTNRTSHRHWMKVQRRSAGSGQTRPSSADSRMVADPPTPDMLSQHEDSNPIRRRDRGKEMLAGLLWR